MDRNVNSKVNQNVNMNRVIPGGNAIWSGYQIVNEKVKAKVKVFVENARI